MRWGGDKHWLAVKDGFPCSERKRLDAVNQHRGVKRLCVGYILRSYVELRKAPITRQSIIDLVDSPARLSERTMPKV